MFNSSSLVPSWTNITDSSFDGAVGAMDEPLGDFFDSSSFGFIDPSIRGSFDGVANKPVSKRKELSEPKEPSTKRIKAELGTDEPGVFNVIETSELDGPSSQLLNDEEILALSDALSEATDSFDEESAFDESLATTLCRVPRTALKTTTSTMRTLPPTSFQPKSLSRGTRKLAVTTPAPSAAWPSAVTCAPSSRASVGVPAALAARLLSRWFPRLAVPLSLRASHASHPPTRPRLASRLLLQRQSPCSGVRWRLARQLSSWWRPRDL